MPIFKCSCKYRITNGAGRTGAWSENYYVSVASFTAAKGALELLNLYRMAFASKTMVWIGTTVTDIANPGITDVAIKSVRGNQGLPADIGKMCLNIKGTAANFSRRNFQFRGLPDELVVNGVYAPNVIITTSIQRMIQLSLTFGGTFQIRSVDRNNPIIDLISVDGIGAVHTASDITLAAGDSVRFYRTRDAQCGKAVKGNYKVLAAPDARHFTVNNWPSGRTVDRGRVRKVGIAFVPVTMAEIVGASTHNIGRDFFPFVGRRSRKQ